VRFFLTLSKSYLSEYSSVGLDRKSYDHSGRVIFLTKLNESGYAIKMFRCYFGIIVSGL